MRLSFFSASSAFISHPYFSSEPGFQLGPDFNLGLGGQGGGAVALGRRAFWGGRPRLCSCSWDLLRREVRGLVVLLLGTSYSNVAWKTLTPCSPARTCCVLGWLNKVIQLERPKTTH